jgi:hypothetical protein
MPNGIFNDIDTFTERNSRMSFWDIAGKVAKGVGSVALDVAKELPKTLANQAQKHLDDDRGQLTSDQREKLQRIVDQNKR